MTSPSEPIQNVPSATSRRLHLLIWAIPIPWHTLKADTIMRLKEAQNLQSIFTLDADRPRRFGIGKEMAIELRAEQSGVTKLLVSSDELETLDLRCQLSRVYSTQHRYWHGQCGSRKCFTCKASSRGRTQSCTGRTRLTREAQYTSIFERV